MILPDVVRIVTTGFEPGAPPVDTIWAVEPPDVRVDANWDAVRVIGLLPTEKVEILIKT